MVGGGAAGGKPGSADKNTTGIELGLLISFGNGTLEYARISGHKGPNMDAQDRQD